MSPRPSSKPQPTAPIACSLEAEGLRTQAQRWAELVRHAGTGRADTSDGVTVTFRADPGVERELRALVAIESECCAWACWEVRADGGLTMSAGATGDGVAVLQSMFPDGA